MSHLLLNFACCWVFHMSQCWSRISVEKGSFGFCLSRTHIVSGIMHVWIMRGEMYYNTLELDKNRGGVYPPATSRASIRHSWIFWCIRECFENVRTGTWSSMVLLYPRCGPFSSEVGSWSLEWRHIWVDDIPVVTLKSLPAYSTSNGTLHDNFRARKHKNNICTGRQRTILSVRPFNDTENRSSG